MSRIVITPNDLGLGLKVDNQKVVVDLDALALPVDVHLDNATYNQDTGNLEITFTGTKGPVYVPLATALGVNTKVRSIVVAPGTAQVTLTDTDQNTFQFDLGPYITQQVSTALQSAKTYTDEEIGKLKGDKLVSLGGVELGHIIPIA